MQTRSLLASLLALSSSAALSAQSPCIEHDGFANSERFGYAACGIGDLDGDGLDDYVVTDPENEDGWAHIFSGNGQLLESLSGHEIPGLSWFGGSVADLGDSDGDGFHELAVGAPLSEDSSLGFVGKVLIYEFQMSPSGLVLQVKDFSVLTGPSTNSSFGTGVANAGDVDGDGVDDLMVYMLVPLSGRVHVYSGADHSLLHDLSGAGSSDNFGQSMCGIGDYNGDGFDDFAIGALTFNIERGRVQVFSGNPAESGTVLLTVDGVNQGDFLGEAIANIGDVNGDGFDELAIGAPGSDAGMMNGGRVEVYAGGSGALLYAINGGFAQWLGREVTGLGDVDEDGKPDFAVGAFNLKPQTGYVPIFSGENGQVIDSLNDDDRLGDVVVGIGDVDGDQRGDVVCGIWRDAPFGSNPSGRASVYCGASTSYPGTNEDLVQKSVTGETATPITDNVKKISAGQLLRIEVDTPSLTFDDLIWATFAQVFVTSGPAPQDAIYSAVHLNLTASPAPFLIAVGKMGQDTLLGPIPAGLEGLSVMLQSFTVTPLAANGLFAATDGHEFQIK
ncbi:MAG: integrin alpha [Planctomycetota bacterium]